MFPWSFHALLLSFTGPVKPCCFFCSQVNIYLGVFQLSKTAFILASFVSNILFISADTECLILVQRLFPPDLFRPSDFYGIDRFEYRIFCPFSTKRIRGRFPATNQGRKSTPASHLVNARSLQGGGGVCCWRALATINSQENRRQPIWG